MKSKLACSVGVAAALLFSGTAFAGKSRTYQVTGPILEMNDTMIAVQKGSERWEIARDASTRANGAMKVGDKVLITYTMMATNVETKAAPADKGPKAASTATATPAKK
ncbi:MAG: hypothetical protein ABI883_07280 [Chthoniobacterales bacterium]